eukprot:TRINITY_DN642_c0_g3_i4.p1 TRINITY_DN642_c0_g3~~TRINITY_DN642_c0_g3_i4.p1  ORF type:complete len:223 (+),score=3.43 TRINITY_DN642_c0_g3_i4:224-892(+)
MAGMGGLIDPLSAGNIYVMGSKPAQVLHLHARYICCLKTSRRNCKVSAEQGSCTIWSDRSFLARHVKRIRVNPTSGLKSSIGAPKLLSRRCKGILAGSADEGQTMSDPGNDRDEIARAALWITYGAYMVWLFILPYAPGDPAWAIKPKSIQELLDLSLNFFFILPGLNALGVHTMEAPVIHPVRASPPPPFPTFSLPYSLLVSHMLFHGHVCLLCYAILTTR